MKKRLRRLPGDCATAALVALAAAAVALGFNALRSNRLDLVARESYDHLIFQPCPETQDQAAATTVADLTDHGRHAFPEGSVVIDARSPQRFAAGHIPAAINLPYDELEGVSADQAAQLKGFKRVIVYCDGWEDESDPEARYRNPPSSLLADELKSLGLESVSFMDGGLKGYLEQGGRLEKTEGPP